MFSKLRSLFQKSAPPSLWTWASAYGQPNLVAEAAYSKVPMVYRCVRAWASNAASVPLRAVRLKNGKTTPLPDIHPLAALLREPSPTEDMPGVIESLITNLALRGEALLEMVPGVGEQPGALRVWPSVFLTKVNVAADDYQSFELNINAEKITLPGKDCIFVRFYSPKNPFRGLAPMEAATMASEVDYAAQKFNRRVFESAPIPAAVLSYEKDAEGISPSVDSEQADRERAELQRLYGGVDRSSGFMVLPPGRKLDMTGSLPRDASFRQLRKMNAEDICATFGVPPILVANVENANRSNSVEQRAMFWQETLIPILRDVESILNRKLARRYGPDIALMFDFTQVPALQVNLADVAEYVTPFLERGVLTANEVREEILKKPPVSWGNSWYRNGGLVETTGVGDADPLRGVDAGTIEKVNAMFREDVEQERARGTEAPAELFDVLRQAKKAERRFEISREAALSLARAHYAEVGRA